MKPAGYLVNTNDGEAGEPGMYYDYITAGNGVFIRARNPFLAATVCVADAEVRGLAKLARKVELTYGRIPWAVYELAVSALGVDPDHEYFVAVTWDGEYHLGIPFQVSGGIGVTYHRLPNTILDVHSHGRMPAWFSWTDDNDELGLGIYMVMGKLHSLWPEVRMRVGVYGYFASLHVGDVFRDYPPGSRLW